jgi:hypothetical protein
LRIQKSLESNSGGLIHVKKKEFLGGLEGAIAKHKGVLRSHHGVSTCFSGLRTSLGWKITATLKIRIFFTMYLN